MTAQRGRRRPRRPEGEGIRQRSPGPTAKPDELAADRGRALRLVDVSRETAARLDRFVAVLLAWQRRINLISPATARMVWTRHVADSLQLLALAPHARVWVDLGSGGGFPGLPIACALAETPGACVHLVESNMKKAAFLREAVRAAAAPAMVHAMRIEQFVASPPEGIKVVTARALAPLTELLAAAYPLLKKGVFGLFPKGQDVERELTEATKYWKIQVSLALSRTDPEGRIVVVRAIEPLGRPRRALGV